MLTWGALVQRSLLAAQQAEKEGVSAMVVDLRTIAPFDWNGIAQAVRKTNRVIVAHEDQLTCGFGAEIAARIAGDLFEHLDAPVRRVAALDSPVAYAPDLEEEILPQASDVLTAILETAEYRRGIQNRRNTPCRFGSVRFSSASCILNSAFCILPRASTS